MNYIYGDLDESVVKVTYSGSHTNTILVTINQDTSTISADIVNVPPELLSPKVPMIDGRYVLLANVSVDGTTYSWVKIDEVLQHIDDLQEQADGLRVDLEAVKQQLQDYIINNNEALQSVRDDLKSESKRTDSMINQLNENVSDSINQLNQNLVDAINTINGGIATEIIDRKNADSGIETALGYRIDSLENNQNEALTNEINERIEADNTLQQNINAEATERKSVDQHIWDILPDNIIAGTPMQGLENENAINIVFSKYQKHGIGEDPADAELVEVPNQAITLSPATQEVAGVLTAADKTKIDNIATDIETAVQAEAEARQEADTALENKLDSLIVVEGAAIQIGDEEHELNIKTGGRFTVNSNYEVVTSEEYPGEPGRRIIPLENNDQIAGKKTDGNGVPLIFVSEWDKVEVGGKGAPLNLNSDDGTVTVNDTYTLLNNEDKDKLNDAIEAEETRATQAETSLQKAIDNEVTRATTQEEALQQAINNETTRAEAKEAELDEAIQNEATARSTVDTQIHEELDAIDTRVGNLEGKTTRLFYGDGTASEPTADGINTFVTTLSVEPPYAAPFEGIAVVVHRTDENTYHIWHYYSNTSKWQDDGVDTVSTFTNNVKGIIQGSTSDGYVAAENGLGRVSGWNTVKTDITNLQNNLNSNVSSINNSISNINQNVANIINDLAANVIILDNAYTQANSAYTQANVAYTRANEAHSLANAANSVAATANTRATNANNAINVHIANINNPHQVSKANVGLANVADVLQYSTENPPPYPVTSVAGKDGAVALGNITFTGIVSGSYNGSTDVEINIPSISGEVGPAAGFGAPTANVTTGEPGTSASVIINASGPNTAKVFDFNFTIPKGTPGVNGYTWIPSVAYNGNISWTSTQAGPGTTPAAMNIMGPTGPAGITPTVVKGTPTGTGVAIVDFTVATEGSTVTITPVFGPINDGEL